MTDTTIKELGQDANSYFFVERLPAKGHFNPNLEILQN
jgi:hypothetical protein